MFYHILLFKVEGWGGLGYGESEVWSLLVIIVKICGRVYHQDGVCSFWHIIGLSDGTSKTKTPRIKKNQFVFCSVSIFICFSVNSKDVKVFLQNTSLYSLVSFSYSIYVTSFFVLGHGCVFSPHVPWGLIGWPFGHGRRYDTLENPKSQEDLVDSGKLVRDRSPGHTESCTSTEGFVWVSTRVPRKTALHRPSPVVPRTIPLYFSEGHVGTSISANATISWLTIQSFY